MNHLSALELRLHNERVRLANASTEGERELRKVWVAQIEKEIEAERGFVCQTLPELTDDELAAELGI